MEQESTLDPNTTEEQQQQQQRQQQTSPTEETPSGFNAGAKRKSFANSVKFAFSSLEPLAQNVSKGFQQVKQIAEEKLGTAEVTQLPHEYLELENRVDRLKQVHDNLIRLATYQLQPGTATEVKLSVNDALSNVADSLGGESNTIATMNDKLKTVNINTQTPNQVMAQEFVRSGHLVGDHTPFGTALLKAAEAQEKIGKSRVQMNNEINEKFVKKMNHQLATSFKTVYSYRRNVHSARVRLDALKNKTRSVSPEKAEEMADELQVIQAEFNSLVSISIDSMKALVNSNEALSCLADYMSAMLAYFQTGFELLSELSPELDSMKVVQDSLFEDSGDAIEKDL